ncbi:hypothetical protein CTA2_9025 [Colletotrichum tanaceti]|uniref:receptor protein-tyrosine kinase n=1 Tax=Colletotrichum tanaceti TaxID=1306861 RepID=A0A4U6XLZ3_9PEZI|nr:hypothetical protein CTA2_9025 [Colletotrichum tanaceti]TKW56654.1 hypothetical protein CTA1_13124 [Colletotrichum tanaceti]
MQHHVVQYDGSDNGDDDAGFPVSYAVIHLSQGGGTFQTGGPVISRVSRVKTATVTITAAESTQTASLTTISSSPTTDTATVTASSMLSATPSSATITLVTSSTQITSLPTSTDSAPAAAHVSVPVNTLIAIIAGTVGGLLLFVIMVAVIHAFVRRRRIVHDETHSPIGADPILEKGGSSSGQQQQHENSGNVGNSRISQPSHFAHPELGMSQQHQTANYMPAGDIRSWPTSHNMYPNQVIAELPAGPHFGQLQHG